MAKNSKARLEASAKYDKVNMTAFTVKMNNKDYEPLKEYLEKHTNINRNAFVISAIREKLQRELEN